MCLYLRTTQQTCTKHHSMITNDYYVKMSRKQQIYKASGKSYKHDSKTHRKKRKTR